VDKITGTAVVAGSQEEEEVAAVVVVAGETGTDYDFLKVCDRS
jgi:hypothetical protein